MGNSLGFSKIHRFKRHKSNHDIKTTDKIPKKGKERKKQKQHTFELRRLSMTEDTFMLGLVGFCGSSKRTRSRTNRRISVHIMTFRSAKLPAEKNCSFVIDGL